MRDQLPQRIWHSECSVVNLDDNKAKARTR